MSVQNTVCIIGNGCAAVEAVKALRENNYDGQIHLISDDIWPSYNPMLTTYYVADEIGFADLFPFGYSIDFYQRYEVKLHLGSPVVELDTENKTIRNQAGGEWKYDQCLVATGAKPLIPRLDGINSSRVYTMRTVGDALLLREALQKSPQKALVVGASMVGIKVVELLVEAGVEICLADKASCLFPLAAFPACAGIIQKKLIEKGIKLRFGESIQGIEESPDRLKVYFQGRNEAEEVDFIVMCIGVLPNIDFLDKEQVKIDRGIVIDEQMKSSVPDLFAAGDVAQGTNLLTGEKQIIGLWSNARYQGRTAGRNMAGREDVYRGAIPHNITYFMDMVFASFGDVSGGTREEIKRDEHSYTHYAWEDERLIGVNMLGASCARIGIIKSAFEKSLAAGLPLNDVDNLCSGKTHERILLRSFSKQKLQV